MKRRARWALSAAFWCGLLACGREPEPGGARPGGAGAPAVAAAASPRDVRLAQDFVELAMPFGETRAAELRLAGADAREARLSIRDPGALGAALSLLPASAEAPAGVALQVQGTQVGMHVGRVTLGTGLPAPGELAFNYTLRVEGTLRVEPTNPVLHLSSPQSPRPIEVSSSAPGFRLESVTTEGPFQAGFKRAKGGAGYTVEVRLLPERLASAQRGVAGKLWLVSNDPAEPRKELPLVAFGDPAEAAAPAASR